MSKDITKIVRQTLGLNGEAVKDAKRLNEALVADPKPFSLPTEFQSAGTKRNHFELYENYIKSFNRISAELDSGNAVVLWANNTLSPSANLTISYTVRRWDAR